MAVFRGIPYAQPPVGARRFRAPTARQRWHGVRDAIAFGPRAPQTGSEQFSTLGGGDGSPDDWLTLNVWSPDLGAQGIPVMVFIHGGAYQKDASSNPHYDCASLARAGAVVVSMNYRVGVEGFAHIAGVPNNRGILDQAAALGWVQTNIAAFGGDPGNVTVFGQSAGAGSIAALLAMPAAAGLFQRAVAQAVPGTFFSPELAADVSAAIAAELNTEATVDELAGICPHDLVRATDAVVQRLPQMVDRWGPMALTPTPFSPVVDGAVLPRAPWAAIADGAAAHIDLLVGHTRDEYRLLAARLSPEVTDAQVSALLDRLAPGPYGASTYRRTYPGATPARLRELVMADWLLRMPSLHLAEAQLAGGRHLSRRCARTGSTSPPVVTRAGHRTTQSVDPPASTTRGPPHGPTPRRARAASRMSICSTPSTCQSDISLPASRTTCKKVNDPAHGPQRFDVWGLG